MKKHFKRGGQKLSNNKSLWKTKQNITPYLFIAPFFILFLTFMLYPFVYSFYLSFCKWDGIGKIKWNGLGNYINLVNDKIFWQSILNGIIEYFMCVPVMLLVALLLAVILTSQAVKFRNFFRTIFFIPNVTAVIAVAYVFLFAYDAEYGFINKFLTFVGIGKISWAGTAFGARFMIVTLVAWRWVGYNMILMMSGLSNISPELYEAAKIDGASSGRIFFKVTIPLMKPVILFCAVMSTIGTFSLFTEPLVLTGGGGANGSSPGSAGGPFNTTMTPILYLYIQCFSYLKMGYASAISYGFFIIVFVLTMFQMKIVNRLEK
jgi:ABC-type sugar transport system permease subunit